MSDATGSSGGASLSIPVYVGRYQLGGNLGLGIALTKKPTAFHRWGMAFLLGWQWVDYTPSTTTPVTP